MKPDVMAIIVKITRFPRLALGRFSAIQILGGAKVVSEIDQYISGNA
jgi:hypothetical protein